MKRSLSFSRRFRSAKMWSWFCDAGRVVAAAGALLAASATAAMSS